MSCRPKPRPPSKEDAGVAAGAPDAPTGLTLAKASCNSAEVRWEPSVDNGLRVTGYAVSFQRVNAIHLHHPSPTTHHTPHTTHHQTNYQ